MINSALEKKKGKRSKRGLLDLVVSPVTGEITTEPFVGNNCSLMQLVCENGKVLVEDTLDDIRKRSNEYL